MLFVNRCLHLCNLNLERIQASDRVRHLLCELPNLLFMLTECGVGFVHQREMRGEFFIVSSDFLTLHPLVMLELPQALHNLWVASIIVILAAFSVSFTARSRRCRGRGSAH